MAIESCLARTAPSGRNRPDAAGFDGVSSERDGGPASAAGVSRAVRQPCSRLGAVLVGPTGAGPTATPTAVTPTAPPTVVDEPFPAAPFVAVAWIIRPAAWPMSGI